MTQEQFTRLNRINVPCRDDGERFTDLSRLEAVSAELQDTRYRLIAREPLFHLYGRKPLAELEDRLVVISTHADCVAEITRFFTRREPEGLLRGTFDNALTNFTAVELMRRGNLPDNVVVAFTGNEEDDALGATDLSRFMEKAGKELFVLVLDVTDQGFPEGLQFTIENNFWENHTAGQLLVKAAIASGENWGFVASDPEDIPGYIPAEYVVRDPWGPCEATCDESWEYDEQDEECASICIPVAGDMHHNLGVVAREKSVDAYLHALEEMARALGLYNQTRN